MIGSSMSAPPLLTFATQCSDSSDAWSISFAPTASTACPKSGSVIDRPTFRRLSTIILSRVIKA